jgi:hypothetical protein
VAAELTIADAALLGALRAWGDADQLAWGALRPSWRERLAAFRDAGPPVDAAAALDRLRREHLDEARPDLGRVHPSWWVRALQGETPAVRLAVVSGLPPVSREPIRAALGLPADDLASDRPPCPEALRCARALWAERLVGHRADPEADPPVVVALTGLDPRALARLVQAIGLAKWALAGEDPPVLSPRDRADLDHFRATLGPPVPGPERLARRDVAEHGRGGKPEEGALGLVTIARLLATVEPYLARWALQHLPYAVARFTRSLMAATARDGAAAEVEARVLHAAWDRLRAEGEIGPDREGPP